MVSVYTPSHDPAYLDDCYRSLAAQTFADWEWIVLLNGGAEWAPPEPDARVRVSVGASTGRVGASKREACALAAGDILLELDHDDVLASGCLREVVAAFDAHPEAVLVYSDFAQIGADGTADPSRFDARMGWEYVAEEVDGLRVDRCRAFEPSPHNVGYIWYAPNHVRAIRRSAYERAGGYDASLEVLDDQELMVRLYEQGAFHHVDACLYLQRMHGANTQRDGRINELIQRETVELYHASIARLATAWARRNGLAVLDLRCSRWPDRTPTPGALDQEIDADAPALPYGEGEVGLIVANELLQRIPDRAAFFAECHRVLAHGGLILTTTPSTDGRGAFQDPTHVAYWNENSFWYLTQARLRERLYPSGDAPRLQISGIRTFFPTEFERANVIPYVAANLLAIKEGPRQGGPLLC